MFEASVPFYPLSVGELVGGKYKIKSMLGEGGMGVVFGATHLDLNCDVAIKVIRQELNQQPELIARLMQEARAAAQIRSDHVCRVLDVSRLDNGSPYVVMEYLDGKNLASVIDAKGRLPERVAVDYLLQACEAIAEAHRSGIVHRDLKPENLFLAEFPDGRRAIKVLDFGISKATGAWKNATERSLTNPSSAMGSPHYMAPEQMTSASDVDARADIWALGAILHQMLTGSLAFDGESLPAVCAAVLQSNPMPVRQILPELSAGLGEAISLCLVKDREQRLGSVADLAHLIVSYGTSQARLSVARISKLLEETDAVASSEDGALGTLLSPRQLPTPKTPIRPLVASPSETTVAVTSSKRVFEVRARTPHRTVWVVVAAVAILVIGGIALRTLPGTRSIPVSTAAGQLPSSVAAVAAPTMATPKVAEVSPKSLASAEAAGLASADIATSAVPAKGEATPPLIPSTANSANNGLRSAQSSRRAQSSKPPAAGVTDPYNLDNFGGRR